MPVCTLTSKGQITLPPTVRKALGLQTLRGRFAGRVPEAVSTEAMREAVQTEAATRAFPPSRSTSPTH